MYHAGTTESIFKTKESLFDLYIDDDQDGSPIKPHANVRYSVNDVDKARYKRLVNHISAATLSTADMSPTKKALVKSAIMEKLPFKKGTGKTPNTSQQRLESIHPLKSRAASAPLSIDLEEDRQHRRETLRAIEYEIPHFILSTLTSHSYFQNINLKIFRALSKIEKSKDPVLRPCRLKNLLGLHPQQDVAFAKELIKCYNYRLTFEEERRPVLWNTTNDRCKCCQEYLS